MVRPPRGSVARGVVPLRAAPDDASELVDEAQYGEVVTRLADVGEWTYVQGPDLYFGWIRSAALRAVTEPRDLVIIGVPLAAARAAPRTDAEVVDRLPAGVPITFREREGDWWRIALQGVAYVQVDETVEAARLPQRAPTAEDLLATAEAFIGVPYRWGGTSVQGIDCSGFTQRVYGLNGIQLDRDADQQALGGTGVERARPGDLFFFGVERVTHTAIATGETTFLHAPEAGRTVQPGTLEDRSRLRAIRRYLP
jgi:cell wall-associated NlpC family hydrolase